MSDIRSMPYVTVEQVHRFREAALSEIAALRSQLEAMQWIKTADRLPVSTPEDIKAGDHHVACWVFVNGTVRMLPFNTYHGCWDDEEYDDYLYDALEPTNWMPYFKPDKPEV